MWILLTRLIGWLAYRVLPVCVAVAAVVVAVGGFFYIQDRAGGDFDRNRAIERFIEEEQRLLEARRELEERLSEVRRELTDARMQLTDAQRTAHRIRTALGFWDRLFAGREEREQREEQLARVEAQEREARERLEAMEARREGLLGEVESTERDIVAVRSERAALDSGDPDLVHYATKSWETVRFPVLLGLAVLVAGPWVFKSTLFFVWAPLLHLTPSIVLRREPLPPIRGSASGVSLGVALAPGETLLIKERFLQASDEGLRRRTKFVFNWRIPFSSLACGLVELIRMHNPGGETTYSTTLSTQEEPTTELALIDVPEGGALVLRPRFLAGVILPAGQRMEIRRHWRFLSAHAWLTLRFRYFEFRGPCRLVVWGKRGVRTEEIHDLTRETRRARRTNQTATIGFTPQLEYHAVRAETFWSFFRGRNPLFDDLFTGTGSFVCQEIAERGNEPGAKRFWSGFWNGILKILGL